MKQLPTEHILSEAAALLLSGQPVALPTETVYGLAASAFNESAILSIFEAKQRPLSDPLILHISEEMGSLEHMFALGLIDQTLISEQVQNTVSALIKAFWPGPLTLLLPKGSKISSLVTASQPFVAIRMPSHHVFLEMIRRTETPLVAPSANLFGRTSPTCADHVVRQLKGRIQMVIDGGTCSVGVESTIVSFPSDDCLMILRPGGISKEKLMQVSGLKVLSYEKKTDEPTEHFPAPGMLSSHYAPSKKLFVLDKNVQANVHARLLASKRVGAISLHASSSWFDALTRIYPQIIWSHLSLTDEKEPCDKSAARNLFSCFHQLDQDSCEIILVEAPASSSHLWSAVWDRLARASK